MDFYIYNPNACKNSLNQKNIFHCPIVKNKTFFKLNKIFLTFKKRQWCSKYEKTNTHHKEHC